MLFALGKLKAAGVALVAQQLVPAALTVPMVLLAPPRLTVEALALACSAGFIIVAIPTVFATRRLRGRPPSPGSVTHPRRGAAAAAGAAAGLGVTLVLPAGGNALEVGSGFIAAMLAVVVFGVVAYALDRGDLRAVAGRLRRFVRSRA